MTTSASDADTSKAPGKSECVYARLSPEQKQFLQRLRKQAGQDVKRDLASCWVLCAPGESQIR